MTVNQRPTARMKTSSAKSYLWKYVRHGHTWKQKLKIASTGKSWLGLRDGTVCCLLCPGITFESSPQLQLCNLLRHHRSTKHNNYVATYLNKAERHGKAPPTDQFQAVMAHVVERGAHGKLKQRRLNGPPDTLAFPLGWSKRRRMEWCLAEAKRNLDREFLRQATVASLMVDARNGSLLVRLAAADAQLNTRSMVLGLKHQYGSRAEHAQKAVMAVIQDMCTGGRGAPGRQGNVMCDADLAEHIRQIVEVFAADAASDEQLAGRELQSPANGGPAMLPNLKIVVRDKAHASRRLLSRPWAADAYLKQTLNTLLFKHKSIVRLIQRSVVFKAWFIANQRGHGGHGGHGDPVVKDLSFAGQRFDSRAKPLARFCWKFDSVIQTAMQIAVRRRGKAEGLAAVEFLEALNPESMLQVGMLADAADEGLRFTRFCDREGMDLGSVSGEVMDFINRINCLFVRRQADATGFTKLMLEAVRRVRVVFLKGRPLTIGDAAGVPPSVAARCFTRMACWVRLCISILKAEFPAFEVIQCFSVFNLGGGRGGHEGHASDRGQEDDLKFQRLSLLCKVDPRVLQAQFKDILPTARRTHTDEGCDVLCAWQRAVAAVTRTPAMMKAHPLNTLLPVLQRFAAYRASTSGVEQSFAHLHFIEKAKRSDASEQAELDALTLRLDMPAALQGPVVLEAQRVWTKYFGMCRNGGRRRFLGPMRNVKTVETVNKVMAVKAERCTETNMLHDRRHQVTLAAQQHPLEMDEALEEAKLASRSAWTSAHQKEHNLQAVRVLACQAELAESGLLLPSERSQVVDQAATVLGQRRAKNWQERQRQQWRILQLERRPTPKLANARVYFARDLRCTPASVTAAIIKHRLRRSGDLAKADVFVVNDPTQAGLLTRLAASLRGGCLVTPTYAVTGGAAGACVAFQPATMQPRWLWASPRFQRQHPRLVSLLKEVMTVRNATMKWTWVDSCSDYLLRCRGKARAQQQKHIGLVTVVDKLRGRAVPGRNQIIMQNEASDPHATQTCTHTDTHYKHTRTRKRQNSPCTHCGVCQMCW